MSVGNQRYKTAVQMLNGTVASPVANQPVEIYFVAEKQLFAGQGENKRLCHYFPQKWNIYNSKACTHILLLPYIKLDLSMTEPEPMMILEDNQGCIYRKK